MSKNLKCTIFVFLIIRFVHCKLMEKVYTHWHFQRDKKKALVDIYISISAIIGKSKCIPIKRVKPGWLHNSNRNQRAKYQFLIIPGWNTTPKKKEMKAVINGSSYIDLQCKTFIIKTLIQFYKKLRTRFIRKFETQLVP